MTLVPRTDGQEVKYLLPEEIITDSIYDVRPGDLDDTEIEQLAQDIETSGQQDALIVSAKIHEDTSDDSRVMDYVESYTLIAGHRRRRAVSLINTKNSALGNPLLKLRVYVDRSITDTNIGLQKAIASNLHRKNFTPMQLALLIERLKKEFGWDKQGFKGTKLVADYLKVNPATITQHEKFLKAPEEVKAGLQSGEFSAQYALMLLTDVKPEKQKEVVEKSRQIQAEEDKKKSKGKKEMTVISESGVTEITESFLPEEPTKKSKSSKAAPARVEEPALRKSIRQTEGATEGPLPLSKKEILSHIQDIADSPAYGFPDGDVRQWAKFFVEEFVTGKASERKLLNKFDKIITGANEGSEKSIKAEKSEEVKPTRAVRKDSKEKPVKPVKPVKVDSPKPKKSVAKPPKS